MGFDNLKQKFFGTWIDSGSTGMSVSEGTRDATDENTINYTSLDPDLEKGKYVQNRMTMTKKDADTYVLEAYRTGPDGEFKSMELTYNRKK